jgi:hypothetical protein
MVGIGLKIFSDMAPFLRRSASIPREGFMAKLPGTAEARSSF